MKAIERILVPTDFSDCAGDAGSDLIVLGTHGRTGLAHLLIGSVAEKVVRKSPVPVLTIRPGRP
jgi:nucleotide-binding universal stress UspA family protein